MRPKAPLLLLAAALPFLAGCNETESSGDGSYASTAAPAPEPIEQPSSELAAETSAFDAGGERLRDAVAGAPVAGGEASSQYWRRSFDGDDRNLGGLDGPPAVQVPGASGNSARAGVGLSAPKKNTLSVKAPPNPAILSVPDADLPAAAPGDGPRGGGPTMAAFDAFQKKVYSYAVPLLSRFGWNARKRNGRDVRHSPYHVTVHHTQGVMTFSEADTAAAVRGIQHYHMVGRAREGKEAFEDIGYHFLIDGSGRIIEGRHAEVLGAHAGESNDGNIGIALMGDFNKQDPTTEQTASLRRLVSFLAIKYKKDPMQKGFLEGHRHFNHTDCPGKNLFAHLDELRRQIDLETERTVKRLDPDGVASNSDFVPLLAVNPSA